MEQKLIAIDLDGTTLNNESKISQYTKNILQKAAQAGHIVSIVTGRPNRISENYYDELNIPTPMINFNGALGHIPHQQWDKEYIKTFSKDIALDLVAEKDKLGIKIVAAEGKTYALADKPNDIIPDFFPTTLRANQVLNAINLKKDPSAMTMLVDENELPNVVTTLNRSFGDKINVGVWGGKNPILELSPKGVDKAKGVDFLAKTYNIDRKNIIAFGDEHNDEPLIDYAGWGVVMKNGTDKLKSLANDITKYDNEHDGMAKYLKEYLKLA